MKYIKRMDIFGVHYKQQIFVDEKEQKSVLSGICSIMVLAASFAYFVYVMNEWWSSRILPNSTNLMKVQNYSQISYNDDPLFEFCYWKYSNEQADPFRLQRNILMPIGIYFIDGIPQKPFSLLTEIQINSTYNTNLLRVNNLSLIQNSGFDSSLNSTRELMIAIIPCNSTLLINGQECASDQEIEAFFTKSVNYISFWLNLKQYDSYSQQFVIVKKQYYLTFDYQVSHQGQLILTQTYANIDTGILFTQYQSKQYIYNAQLITSATNKKFWSTLLGENSFLNLFIRLDPMSIDTQIVYPKLGEILAQVGSIVSMLMAIQYFLSFYNEQLLDSTFIDKVLEFYFLDYAELKKSKQKSDQLICKDLIDQAKKKLAYTNIIYELSRIQLFLLNHFGRNQLFQTHQYTLWAKEDLKQSNSRFALDNLITAPKAIVNKDQNQQHFEKEDFNLLCRRKLNIFQNNEDLVRVYQDVGNTSLQSIQL
ncbi:unnamed protein product [Paramecium sonneborni]|uniref:Transmembrane protein n=1 Tax=Paramecium sonneborni TaxID=65129 RepID=A0A8S1QU44_9CILI|nr:unnamed protein product [Paramecium sonneborni]